jgi:hypothetical protein
MWQVYRGKEDKNYRTFNIKEGGCPEPWKRRK